MKKIALITALLIGISTFSMAQDYSTGIGLRGGLFNGITIKHFVGNHNAFEGIISSRWQGFNVTGLYEIHNQAFKTGGLNWYYGFGGHIGSWNGSNVTWATDNLNYTVIGIDGIIGIEYNFPSIPFNISADWKPAINLVGYSGYWLDSGAISFRYVF